MKVAVVTGTRAEFGLLAPLMHKIESSEKLDLQLIVTGAHLLAEFGSTVGEIRAEGFTIDRTVPEITSASTGQEVARQVGAGVIAFTDTLVELEPNVVVLLGDRYELLAAATAAFFLDIPIVHVHGGEVTQGAFDDAIRHAISKFARVNAVAAPEYAERLIRAGEQPDSVHVVGGLGVDALANVQRLPRHELETELRIRLGDPLFLVTYHPVTAAAHDTKREISSLAAALEAFPEATVVFTLPNADPEHEIITMALEQAVLQHDRWHLFSSLGTRNYVSLLSEAAVVVGNSSSGLLEAPSLEVPSVNIGPRQDGRLAAQSVLSCGTNKEEIEENITRAISRQFADSIRGMESPYGKPGATDRIIALLGSIPFDTLVEKVYYDPPEKK
jgi:UDP-hydrolysing UDP-N-acetyl-D-glucosamine 2-epimerase